MTRSRRATNSPTCLDVNAVKGTLLPTLTHSSPRIPGTPCVSWRDAPPASTGGSDTWGTHPLLCCLDNTAKVEDMT
jgi:hypothetical protein